MESEAPSNAMRAMVDFACLDAECSNTVRFNVMELHREKGRISCPACHLEYRFKADFVGKLKRLRRLVFAVMEAEDILGDASVAVTTGAGDVRIPYRLLLTRLNTIISLDVGGRKVDFNFRVEPLNQGAFK